MFKDNKPYHTTCGAQEPNDWTRASARWRSHNNIRFCNMSDMTDEDTSAKSFADLGLNQWLLDQCKAVGMSKPTPIQYNCVPEILKGEMIDKSTIA